jgi:hypothetical protein
VFSPVFGDLFSLADCKSVVQKFMSGRTRGSIPPGLIFLLIEFIMKIVSPFRDYYDNASGWHSNEPLYVRKTQEILIEDVNPALMSLLKFEDSDPELRILLKNPLEVFRRIPRSQDFDKILIGFCGRLIPGYTCVDDSNLHTFYSAKQLESWLEDRKQKYHATTNYEGQLKRLRGKSAVKRSWHLNIKSWDEFLSSRSFNIPVDLFLKLQAPVFILDSSRNKHGYRLGKELTLHVNPRLNQFDFAKIIDPYTAYQELDLYLGNDMAIQMNPDTFRTQEMIRDSKGFDNWSFKRHKEESKKPRKKKRKKS